MSDRFDKYQSAEDEGRFGARTEKVPKGHKHMSSGSPDIPSPSPLYSPSALPAPPGDKGVFDWIAP